MIRRRVVLLPLRAARLGRLALLLLGSAMACESAPASNADSAVAQAPKDTGAVTDKYVPSVDEGLGASIAILIDNSGSMKKAAEGDSRRSTSSRARRSKQCWRRPTRSWREQPDFPINVGLYRFSSPRDGDGADQALRPRPRLKSRRSTSMPEPDGGTAIGRAMDVARDDLYRAGTFRKYILVVTDGENTDGVSPRRIAQEINRRSEGAVRMYFVAFDVDAERFALRARRARRGGRRPQRLTRSAHDSTTIYRGKILSEAVDAGETSARLAADSASRDSAKPPTTPRKDTRP